MWKRLVVAAFTLAGLAACERAAVTPLEVPQAAVQSRAAAAGTLVEIKFREALEVRPDAQQRLRSNRGASLAALQAVLDRHGARDLRPLLSVPADKVAGLVAAARSRSAEPVPDMASWHRLVLPRGADVEAALAELRERPEVEHAYVAPEPAPPPVTPDFTSYQANYFGAAPSGTENTYARSLAGGRGVGVVVTDLEYDWYFGHEDLGLFSSILITGQPYTYYGSNHGTATLGILAGRDNGIGITGGAPDATIRVASPMYNGSYNPANAITQAAAHMIAGDVLLLEQQTSGPAADPEYIPLEWIVSVYDAIRLATGAGIVVIEPAGNGGRNLDSSLYGGRFNRSQFDSRAIIVGAGDGNNARLGFSSYGSRVDVQAHGTTVATTGYGGLGGTSLNDYYGYFSGTSSASAIVAAAATTLQGYQKHRARPVLTPSGMASLFKSTGSAQTGNTAERIGPKPNLRAAIAQIDPAPTPLGVSISGPYTISQKATYTYTSSVSGASGVTYDWQERSCEDNASQNCTAWGGFNSIQSTYTRVLGPDCTGTGERNFQLKLVVRASDGRTATDTHKTNLCGSIELAYHQTGWREKNHGSSRILA